MLRMKRGSAISTMNKIMADLDAEEGITKEMLDFVDLDIEFSPVLAFRGESLGQEVEVVPTQGARYIIRHPAISSSIGKEELKRMRLRYLLKYKAWQRQNFAPLIEKLHQ